MAGRSGIDSYLRQTIYFKGFTMYFKGKGKFISSLYETDIFKGIDPKELDMIFEDIETQTYPADTILYSPEDSCERLYILRQGQVDLYQLSSTGKRLVTRQITPGSTFGIMGLLGQTIEGNFAETTEASTICVLTRENVLSLIKRRPEVGIRILEIVGNRLRLLEERLMETICNPVRERLAYFLLINTDPTSGELRNVTHEEIGDIIGVVRQTITEALNRMRQEGLITIGPKRIGILNRPGLEEIVRGSKT